MGIGIDLGQSAVKVVELRNGLGKAKLSGVARKRVARARLSDLPQLLSDGVASHLHGKRAVLGVSGRDINLQMQIFPGTKLTNYPAMVRNEITNRRGESADLYIDHATLRRPDQYFPFYLTAFGVAKNSFIDERMDVALSMGATPVDVVPTPFALMAAYSHSYGVENGTVMLLNIGSDNTDIVLVQFGRMIFARNVSQGARMFDEQIKTMGQVPEDEAEGRKIRSGSLTGGDPTDPLHRAVRQAAYQFVGVIQSTLNYARTQLDDKELSIDKIYLSGGGAKITGLDTYLKSALKADVELLDPFRKIDVGLASKTTEGEITSLPSDLAVAVGLAHIGNTRHRHAVLSLVPDRVRERRKFLSTVPFLVAACIFVAATLVFITMSLKVQKDQLEKEARSVTSVVSKLKEDQEKLAKLEADFRQIYVKHDTLQNQAVTPRVIMETYAKLRRMSRDGLQIEKVELSNPITARRVIVNVPNQGHVAGTYQSEDEQNIVTKESGALPKGEYLTWDTTTYRLTIHGEIEENIKGGANEILLDLNNQLADAAIGTTAEIVRQDASPKRPGWRSFSIEVKFK